MHYILLRLFVVVIFTAVEGVVLQSSVDRELKIYQERVKIFSQKLSEECPEQLGINGIAKREILGGKSVQETILEGEKALYLKLVKRLIECRNKKLNDRKSSATSNTTTANIPIKATPTASTTTSNMRTAPTTRTEIPCNERIPNKLNIGFIKYSNPMDQTAGNTLCDRKTPNAASNDHCDFQFEICVQDLGKNDCGYLDFLTPLVTSGLGAKTHVFGSRIGNSIDNPIVVDIPPNAVSKVLNIVIDVWDSDENIDTKALVNYDLIDRFDFNVNITNKEYGRITLLGNRAYNTTILELLVVGTCQNITMIDPITLPYTTPTTTAETPCTNADPTVLKIHFLNYTNYGDLSALGVRCDSQSPDDLCDLALDLCISPLNTRTCKYHASFTAFDATEVLYFKNYTRPGWTNPVVIDVNEMWQGVNVFIKVVDQELHRKNNKERIQFENIDTFEFVVNVKKDTPSVIIEHDGKRVFQPTRLTIAVEAACRPPLCAASITKDQASCSNSACQDSQEKQRCPITCGQCTVVALPDCTGPDSILCDQSLCADATTAVHCPATCGFCKSNSRNRRYISFQEPPAVMRSEESKDIERTDFKTQGRQEKLS